MARRFTAIGLLAQGGMAELYLARDAKSGELVALKRVRPDLRCDPAYAAMFEDEAAIWRLLRHPNVVALIEHGCDDDGPYIAAELVDGTDLGRLIAAKGPLELEVALGVAAALFEALAYLHNLTDDSGRAMHLVHRDVSPGNVLCSRSGEVKLTDFGVARAAVKTHVTVAGVLKGKLAYMSPEQTRGEPLGPQSDLFSAGVVLWEMLAGRPLFDRPTDADTARAVREAPIPPLSEVRPDAAAALQELLDDLLERDPDSRLDDADAAAMRIRRAARELGLGLRPEAVARCVCHVVGERSPEEMTLQEARRRTALVARTPGKRSGRARTVAAAGSVGVLAAVMGLLYARGGGDTLRDEARRAAMEAAAETVAPSADEHDLVAAAGSSEGESDGRAAARRVRKSAEGESPGARRSSRSRSRAGAEEGLGGVGRGRSARRADAAAESAGAGLLDINCEPWAEVIVDGRSTGRHTPVRGLVVPAGHHKVTLRNPVFGIERTIEVRVAPNQRVRRSVVLTAPVRP